MAGRLIPGEQKGQLMDARFLRDNPDFALLLIALYFSEFFLHPDAPEHVALDRGGIGDREAEFLIESDGGLAAVDHDMRKAEITDPRFCFVHHAAAEFTPAVLRQNDNSPNQGGRRIDRIDPAGRDGKLVVGQNDILRLRRVFVVKFPP